MGQIKVHGKDTKDDSKIPFGQKLNLHCSNCNTRKDCVKGNNCWICTECYKDITSKFKDVTFRWKGFCGVCRSLKVMLWSGQEYICDGCLEPTEEIA